VRVVRRTGLIKVAVGLVALGGLGVLFVRSARNVQAEPYEVARGRLAKWTLAIEPGSSASGILLALRPQAELASALFSQVFTRSGESLSGPVPAAMPLVLQSEFDRAIAGTLTPDALLAAARAAGLEPATFQLRCMAQRRVSQPGLTRQVFFLRFDWPAFDEFRRDVARRLRDAGGHASAFEPAALSPVLIIAATDASFSTWLPLNADPAVDDCLAPIAVR
jgi:hypothetical protein